MLIFDKSPLFYSQTANILDHIFCIIPGQLSPVPSAKQTKFPFTCLNTISEIKCYLVRSKIGFECSV